MAIERVGQFIEFLADENGLRTLARINSIALCAETDPLGQEVFITVSNRTFRVGATIDEMREVLLSYEEARRMNCEQSSRRRASQNLR